jgi:hypothetical protein
LFVGFSDPRPENSTTTAYEAASRYAIVNNTSRSDRWSFRFDDNTGAIPAAADTRFYCRD